MVACKPILRGHDTPTQFKPSFTYLLIGKMSETMTETELTEHQQKILTLIKKCPIISGQQLSVILSVSQRTIDDIRAQDFILTPGRYVGIAEQEDDGEPFEDKMKRLTSELSGLFEQSHQLEEEIRKQLGSIGFNV